MANESICPISLGTVNGTSGPKPSIEQYETSLLMLLGFGGVSIILALLYNAVRKYIFHDHKNLDTTFDAGGNVTTSLTAVTMASQMFWPGDILHGAILTAKLGIGAPFWFSISLVVNVLLFPMLSVQFKTRAPGAKTYLQVKFYPIEIIRARFGKSAHLTYCCLAFLTNIVVMADMLLAGKTAIQSLTRDASDEFVLLVMATLFGSYSLIGGIGSTFYVSYFNACLIFVFLHTFFLKILYNSDNEYVYLGDDSKIFRGIACVENTQHSFLTFQSSVAVMYGVVGLFLGSSFVYTDQASWQSQIAAKPIQGAIGFILSGCMWFAMYNGMALTTGLAYIALSAENGSHILSTAQIDQGFVTPFVVHKILGPSGAYMVLTMLSMALMSTGSGEVMAVSSILVYDIYQTYIAPYRKCLLSTQCIMCGKSKKQNNINHIKQESLCQCVDFTQCQQCQEDRHRIRMKSGPRKHCQYKCLVHGQYRQYEDYLIRFKNWCIVFVTMSIVPFGLIIFKIGVDLNWMFLVGAVVLIPSLPPVILSIFWVKTTATGVITGGVAGLLLGIAAILTTASTYDQGLNNFLVNTSQEYSILAGTCFSFGASLTGSIVISMFTNRIKTCDDENIEWQKLYDIDNPLNPWELNYRDEFKGQSCITKPTQLASKFLRAKKITFIFGICGIILFIVIIPGIMLSFSVFTENLFKCWMGLTLAWTVVMGIFAVVAPPIEETIKIFKQKKVNKHRCRVDMLIENTQM